jgi:hypothetical protein
MSSHPTTNGRRFSWKALITWVVAVVVTGIALAVGIAVWSKTERLSFDSAVWKRDSFQALRFDRDSATRDRMVDDLLRRYRLTGMQKPEVTTLLGDPDFTNSAPFKDWDMIYWLGPDARGGFGGLDFMWLVLKLDSTGRVTDFKVACD